MSIAHIRSYPYPRPRTLWLPICFALLSAGALAQTEIGSQQDREAGDRHHGPPLEAITACKDKASGAACNFAGRQGEQLTGTCFNPPPRPASTPGAQPGANGDSTPRPMACRPARKSQ